MALFDTIIDNVKNTKEILDKVDGILAKGSIIANSISGLLESNDIEIVSNVKISKKKREEETVSSDVE